MSAHIAISNGCGSYCSRCGVSWDLDEAEPEDCVGAATRILVALTGRKGSGKDTAAESLVAHGFVNVKMAGALKAMLRALLEYRGASAEMIDRMLEGDLKETPSHLLGGRTPRRAMQTLGTDWGRDMMHKDLWVDATGDRIDTLDRAVVSDIRFPNEVAMVKRRGGRLYRVARMGLSDQDAHESETQIDALPCDGVIANAEASAEAFTASAGRLLRAELRL